MVEINMKSQRERDPQGVSKIILKPIPLLKAFASMEASVFTCMVPIVKHGGEV